jgi:hypothetical protein
MPFFAVHKIAGMKEAIEAAEQHYSALRLRRWLISKYEVSADCVITT